MFSKVVKIMIFISLLNVMVYFPKVIAQEAEQGTSQAAQRSAPDQSVASEESYLIGPNNLLLIKVVGETGLQQVFRVDDAGYITHPLAGRVKLGGQTVSQAEETIKSVLSGDYILNPYITIFVMEHSRVSVLGEVRKAGSYEIVGRMSIIEAISMAGGFTPVANEKKVKVLRRDESGEKTIMVNVEDIINGQQQDFYVQAEDVIDVPKSFF